MDAHSAVHLGQQSGELVQRSRPTFEQIIVRFLVVNLPSLKVNR
jgi:hypothetical protein